MKILSPVLFISLEILIHFKRNARPHGEKDNLQLLSTIDLNFIFQNKMIDITF